MPNTEPIYIGIDLGTGGVRAVAVTGEGEVLAESAAVLPAEAVKQSGDVHEQDADTWWVVAETVVRNLVSKLRDNGVDPNAIAAVAVDGTSGTIVPIDGHLRPLRPALMYNDGRAVKEAAELTTIARQAGSEVSIAASYAIARIRWIQKHEPKVFRRTFCFAHQADFIAWHFMYSFAKYMCFPVTDYSNALKTGYDLSTESWPNWLTAMKDIRKRLPSIVSPPGEVVQTGEVIPDTKQGKINIPTAKILRLPKTTVLVTGCSDGTAGFLASGAKNLGDDNTTLGTTLVLKRIADTPVNNELVYSHKLPGGRWLPGAASNTGGEWIRQQFPNAKLAELDAQAEKLLPIDVLAYPIARTGERFPFKHSMAASFIEPAVNEDLTRYAAMLQGTALFERLCYEQLNQETAMTADQLGDVYATGGGAKSDVWLQLRANVTGRTYHVPAYPESAMGAAILAATGATQQPLWDVIDRMVRIDRTFTPDTSVKAVHDKQFERFKESMRQRGWL